MHTYSHSIHATLKFVKNRINTVKPHMLMIGISATNPGHNQNLGIQFENHSEQSEEMIGLIHRMYLEVH